MDSDLATTLLEVLKEGGALAILAVVLYLIAMRAFPAFLRALTEQRNEFTGTLKNTEESHERTITTITASNEKIMNEMRNDSNERLKLVQDMQNRRREYEK